MGPFFPSSFRVVNRVKKSQRRIFVYYQTYLHLDVLRKFQVDSDIWLQTFLYGKIRSPIQHKPLPLSPTLLPRNIAKYPLFHILSQSHPPLTKTAFHPHTTIPTTTPSYSFKKSSLAQHSIQMPRPHQRLPIFNPTLITHKPSLIPVWHLWNTSLK